MPELPEVETIASQLRNGNDATPSLIGQVILGAELHWARSLATPDPDSFYLTIKGQQITAISRRGKFLLINLEDQTIAIHLRMSGDIRFEPVHDNQIDTPIQPHDRMIINFESGWRIVFNDTRKFGRVWLTDDIQQILRGLGPEPFDPTLHERRFFEMLQNKKRMIKPLLMDQHFLAGLGNIYTDEALFMSKIHPLTIARDITSHQAGLLLNNIRDVLRAGIEHNGSSIDWVYRGGSFQNYFCVYGRAGEPCYTCGTPIARMIVGQRGTHYCPVCQILHE